MTFAKAGHALSLLAFLSICPSFLSCNGGGESSHPTSAALTGRWELTRAYRNQKPTETLAGTYFDFLPDGNMQTNLPVGAESPTPFSLEKEILHQKSQPPLQYTVAELTDSTLKLSTQLRGFQFDLHFIKQLNPPPVDTVPAQDSLEEAPEGESMEERE